MLVTVVSLNVWVFVTGEKSRDGGKWSGRHNRREEGGRERDNLRDKWWQGCWRTIERV